MNPLIPTSLPAAGGSAGAAPSGPPLRDIHLPGNPPLWPPAPGWWLLMAALIVAALALWWWRRRVRERQRRLARVLSEVDLELATYQRDGDAARLASALHQLVRRGARRLDPASAQQRGAAWRATLAQARVDAATLEQVVALEQHMYRNHNALDADAAASAVRRWLAKAWQRKPLAAASGKRDGSSSHE